MRCYPLKQVEKLGSFWSPRSILAHSLFPSRTNTNPSLEFISMTNLDILALAFTTIGFSKPSQEDHWPECLFPLPFLIRLSKPNCECLW